MRHRPADIRGPRNPFQQSQRSSYRQPGPPFQLGYTCSVWEQFPCGAFPAPVEPTHGLQAWRHDCHSWPCRQAWHIFLECGATHCDSPFYPCLHMDLHAEQDRFLHVQHFLKQRWNHFNPYLEYYWATYTFAVALNSLCLRLQQCCSFSLPVYIHCLRPI